MKHNTIDLQVRPDGVHVRIANVIDRVIPLADALQLAADLHDLRGGIAAEMRRQLEHRATEAAGDIEQCRQELARLDALGLVEPAAAVDDPPIPF